MITKVFVWIKELLSFSVRIEVLNDNNMFRNNRDWVEPLGKVNGINVVAVEPRSKIRIKKKYNDVRYNTNKLTKGL